MDYHTLRFPNILFVLALGFLFLWWAPGARAQSGSGYEILPAPDVWYNSVDGVRVGARVIGRTPGSFGTGRHRVNAGIWLGTNFPDHPVSYYFSLTEPIPSLSDFGSEANIKLKSSYRTGFQSHGLSFNKRWQTGFDELNYTEFSVGVHAEDRFDRSYLLYNQLWQSQWLFPISVNLLKTNKNGAGRYTLSFNADANFAGDYSDFLRAEAAFHQHIPIVGELAFSGRLYTGLATENTAPEYGFMRSMEAARGWMGSGFTRARGTIPPSWMESGNIQVTGGANLRGYLYQDIQTLNGGFAPLYTFLSSVNLALDYPNPLGRTINNIPIVGDFVDLRSYFFFDAGTSWGLTEAEESRLLADAGPGFLLSINIPNVLGKARGLVLRYDLPLWLSDPGQEDNFKFRNVIGIGTIISF